MEKLAAEKISIAYILYSEKIKRHVFYRVNSRDIAEDILQEAFLKTWQYINDDSKKIDDPKNFIFTVVNNLIIDHYRQKSKKEISLEGLNYHATITIPDWEIAFNRNAGKKIILKHLPSLRGKYKKILSYHFLENLTISEISRLTGRSPNNVSVIKHRGLKMLKKIIDYQAVSP